MLYKNQSEYYSLRYIKELYMQHRRGVKNILSFNGYKVENISFPNITHEREWVKESVMLESFPFSDNLFYINGETLKEYFTNDRIKITLSLLETVNKEIKNKELFNTHEQNRFYNYKTKILQCLIHESLINDYVVDIEQKDNGSLYYSILIKHQEVEYKFHQNINSMIFNNINFINRVIKPFKHSNDEFKLVKLETLLLLNDLQFINKVISSINMKIIDK